MIRLCGSGGYGCVQVPGKAFLPFAAAGAAAHLKLAATADRQNFAQLYATEGLSLLLSSGHLLLEEVSSLNCLKNTSRDL